MEWMIFWFWQGLGFPVVFLCMLLIITIVAWIGGWTEEGLDYHGKRKGSNFIWYQWAIASSLIFALNVFLWSIAAVAHFTS